MPEQEEEKKEEEQNQSVDLQEEMPHIPTSHEHEKRKEEILISPRLN